MKKYLLITAVLLFVSILSACGDKDNELVSGEPSTEISINMSEFMFDPITIIVPAGQEVTLSITNSGGIEHSYVIMAKGYAYIAPFDAEDQANIFQKFAVSPGKTETFTFTAPAETGDYQVVCDIPGHGEAGMIGNMTVK